MTDTLTGIYAGRCEILPKGTNDPATGRPAFQVFFKQGAVIPSIGGRPLTVEELAVVRTEADGSQAVIALDGTIALAPLSIPAQALAIAENPEAGDQLGTLTATGGSGTKVFAIAPGGNGSVTISPTGVVTVAADALGDVATPTLFDFEATPSFTVPIQVTDDTGTAAGVLTVSITNANEAPAAESVTVTLEDTATGAGTTITALPTITDPDIGDTHITEIYAGDTSNEFSVSGGNLISNAPLSSLVVSNYILTMRVVDSGGAEAFYTITINIELGNAAPALTLTNTIASLPEDAALVAAQKLADIVVTESDGGQGTNTLSLSGADAAKFELIGTQLFARQGQTFPVADAPFIVSIDSDDPAVAGAPDASVVFSLDSSGPNEAPVGAGTATYTIADDTFVGTAIGDFSATDSDPSATITATLTQGLQTFALSQFGTSNVWRLSTAAGLDAATQATHNMTITFTDQFGASSDFPVSVIVIEALEITTNSLLSFEDGAANGFVIETLAAAGGTGGNTWSRVGGSTAFAIAANGDLSIADNTGFAEGQTYQVIAQVEDSSGVQKNRTFQISITALQQLALVSNTALNITENSPNGTTLGTITAANGTAPLTFSLVGGAGSHAGMFAISTVNDQGEVTVADNTNLDYESAIYPFHTVTFRVRVEDSSNPQKSTEANYSANILDDAAEPPTSVGGGPFNFTESQTGSFGTVTATDPEGTAGGTFAILSGDLGLVTINSSTGDLSPSGSPSTPQTLTLSVQFTDSTSQSVTGTVTVEILPDLAIANAAMNIDEHPNLNDVIGNIGASGGVAGYTYAIVTGGTAPTGAISVDAAGDLLVATPSDFDFETMPTNPITVEVEVTDSDSPANVETFTVTVTVNDTVEPTIILTQDFKLPSDYIEVSGNSNQSPAFPVSTAMLEATEAGVTAANLTYTVTSATNLQFYLNGTVSTTFTQADIDAGNVRAEYVTANSWTSFYSNQSSLAPTASLSIASPNGNTAETLVVIPQPAVTVFAIDESLTTHTVQTSELNAIGIGSTNAQLSFNITRTGGGNAFFYSGTFTPLSVFTQADIVAGSISYFRGNSGTNTFEAVVTGANGESSVSYFFNT